MPIGGFIITHAPADREAVRTKLAGFPALEIYGEDERGNIVAVIDTDTSDEMDAMVHRLEAIEEVLSVGLAYLNAEDEIERIASGELKPERLFGTEHKKKRPPEST